MSVSLLEVLESAGFDVKNNIEDARWLLAQESDFDELIESANDLEDDYSDYEDYRETHEELGDLDVQSFEDWREEAKKNTEEENI